MAQLSRSDIENDLPWSWTPERVARQLRLADTNAYVATFGKQLAGFTVASFSNRHAHLVLMAVNSQWRRQGLGNTLMNWQITAAQTAGLQAVLLEVRDRNRNARLFYQQLGFRYVETLKRYYCGREDAVRMRLSPIRVPVPDPHNCGSQPG